MFYEKAREWIEELRQQGRLKEYDDESLERLTRNYSRQLEAYFNDEIIKQLKPQNKDQEYERMLLWDSQYTFKYLNQTIPAFQSYKEEIFSKAKKFIIDANSL